MIESIHMSWIGKKVLILGLGQYPKGSGVSAALYVADQGAEVLVSDIKQAHELGTNVARLKRFKNVSFRLGEHSLGDIDWADIIIRNPRVRQNSPEMKRALKLGKRVESDISIFLQQCSSLVVGITGTRGKSTTSTLVHDMLIASKKQVWLGGNILVSPLTFIDKVQKKDIVVLELSSWLLETTGAVALSPQIACITNLMRDHLNSYENMEEYGEAKAQIFRHQGPKDILIVNADDEFCRGCAKEAPGHVEFFSKKKKAKSAAWIEKGQLMMRDKEKDIVLVSCDRLQVRGDHMYANMLAAALTARAAGCSVMGIRQALLNFTGLQDRQEIVAVKAGVTCVNDTTATTPDGVIAAIRAFAPHMKTMRLILGGSDKELDFSELSQELKKYTVSIALLPGTAHDKFSASLRRARVAYTDVADLSQAMNMHFTAAQQGDAIILSPGCASFGAFANEFERGEVFRSFVDAWKPKK